MWLKNLLMFMIPKDFSLPDIVSYLQNETNLTRRAIVEILTKKR